MSDYTLTPFEQITRHLPHLSPFQALWNEAEELLADERPEGFDVLEIGRLVWEDIPEEEKPAALDALFYCWWTGNAGQPSRSRPGVRDD